MNRIAFLALAALLATLLASTAFGAPGPFYFNGRLGGALLGEIDLDNVKVDFEPGAMASAALGYDLTEGRLEAEVGYRRNGVKQISVQPKGVAFDPGGNFSALSFMLNSVADFQIPGALSPYIFAGLGAAQVSINQDLSLGVGLDDTDDLAFAYQGGAGVGYPLTNTLTLDLEYRYFATLDTAFKTKAGEEIDIDYAIHNILMGIRFVF